MIFNSCMNIHGALFLAAGGVSGGQIKGAELPRLPVWSGSGTVLTPQSNILSRTLSKKSHPESPGGKAL